MSSEGELRTALTDVLENSGVLSSLRANLRAEIFKALEDGDAAEPPKLPSVNVFINELILEYLMYNNHRRTASMLEAGLFKYIYLLRYDKCQNCLYLSCS